jgi:hypothetical protein
LVIILDVSLSNGNLLEDFKQGRGKTCFICYKRLYSYCELNGPQGRNVETRAVIYLNG